MEIVSLPIGRLRPHPRNSNVMPDDRFKKLVEHLEVSGRYPPVIVRPQGEEYQVLDGHHRVKALQRLQRPTVRCDVWDVDDNRALLLRATLNRLEGRDDPRKRAALLGELAERFDAKSLPDRLPEDAGRLKKLLRLNDTLPAPRPPRAMGDMPVALHFFVLPAQRSAIERRLREHGGTRESALLTLLGLEDDGVD
ncbi:MAG: ParB/RepB/Spo0J family partition protein [Planctomycetota bacterium]